MHLTCRNRCRASFHQGRPLFVGNIVHCECSNGKHVIYKNWMVTMVVVVFLLEGRTEIYFNSITFQRHHFAQDNVTMPQGHMCCKTWCTCIYLRWQELCWPIYNCPFKLYVQIRDKYIIYPTICNKVICYHVSSDVFIEQRLCSISWRCDEGFIGEMFNVCSIAMSKEGWHVYYFSEPAH